jgi:hypothetical protein
MAVLILLVSFCKGQYTDTRARTPVLCGTVSVTKPSEFGLEACAGGAMDWYVRTEVRLVTERRLFVTFFHLVCIFLRIVGDMVNVVVEYIALKRKACQSGDAENNVV